MILTKFSAVFIIALKKIREISLFLGPGVTLAFNKM